MDDGDKAFELLLAAMEEQDKEDPFVDEPVPPISHKKHIESTVSESPEVLQMKKRIQELEEQLNRRNNTDQKETTPEVSSPSRSQSKILPKKSAVFDLFSAINNKSKENISVMPVKTDPREGRLTLSDLGLSDSSDDEEGPALNATGRQIKRKLEEQLNSDQSFKRTPSATQDTAVKYSVFSVMSAPLKSPPISAATPHAGLKTIIKCPFSGLRITHAAMDLDGLKDAIGHKKMCKLSQLPILKSSIDNRSEWVTIGVVVQKIPAKTSASGTQFGIWKISDLEDTVNLTTLFLFSDAFKDTWKVPVRTVIAVLDATIMPKKEGKNELAISVNTPGRVLELGFAVDMGICKAQTKSGNPCTNLVNAEKGDHCVYHLKAALQKVSSQRMDLQSNWSGVQPNSSKIAKIADGMFYGGKMFSAGKTLPDSKGRKASVVLTSISKEAQLLIDEARSVVKNHLNPHEQKTLEKITSGSEHLNRLIVNNGPGTRNLVRSVAKVEDKKTPSKFISPSQLLKQQQESMQKLLSSQGVDTSKKIVPMLGRGLTVGGSVNLDFSTSTADQSNTLAKRASISSPAPTLSTIGIVDAKQVTTINSKVLSQVRALEKLRQAGKTVIAPSDPNRLQNGISAAARERIEQRLRNSIPVPEKDLPRTSKPVICNLKDDPEIKALLEANSRNEDLCKVGEMEFMDGYFKKAAVKESIEEQLEQTQEIECDVVTCRTCNYTAVSLAARCITERHDAKRHKATKRFFQCRQCSKRKPTYAFLPSPCKICGKQNFKRCGMLAYERKAPKLDSETLLIRGEEHSRFLNGTS